MVVALTAILGVTLGLRLYGLDWDRGYSFTPHPDERVILMKVGELSLPALGQVGVLLDPDESPWNPRWVPYGSFPLYLLKGVQLLYSALPGVELSDLRIPGRTISALADVGTVALVFLLGSRLYGRREALLASGLLALAVLHIQLSHFYAVDTLLGFSVVAAMYFLYRVAREGRTRDSLLAGAFIGLGMATKVSLAPVCGAFVLAHLFFFLNVWDSGERQADGWLKRFRRALVGLAAGAGMSLLVFVVVQPYTFLDWSRFKADVIEQSEMVRRIRDYPYTRQYIDTAPYWHHIRQLATWGLGWPLGVVAWGGLLYAALRGMRLGSGLAYLGLGLCLPMALLLYSTSLITILAASGIAFVALMVTLPLRSRDSRAAVLLLSWVVPYFLIIGAFEVKFLRYLIPITPALLLFGSRMVIALWDRVTARSPRLRPWLAAAIALMVGATGFYALSYMAVYGEPHTAVRTSLWINDNAPKGSVILKEHWEEGIPNLQGYEVRELPMYEADGPGKIRRLSEDLAEADYLWFFSNRLYGTIPRLPERYPLSSEYYRLLFSGALGYELADVETAYPRLAGLSFVDDTFGRADLPRPSGMETLVPKGAKLNLGFADESFSVYDHPMGMVFRNAQRFTAETIRQAIENAVPESAAAENPPPDRAVGLLLSPEDAQAQQQGGTWPDIIHADSWTNRYPVVAWLLLVEVIALLALPITFVLFRPLTDGGYLFSKALGILVVGLVVWLLASLHWMSFSRSSVGLALLVLGAVSVVTLARRRRQFLDFVRQRWRLVLIAEVIFLAAFVAFVLLRMANPDLWHFYRGGEKPMELAYLNAVLRSSYMPPYDPWFAGGYLNYYYWGQFIVAMLIKTTGIEPAVAFNLAVPLFFALAVGGAYTVGFNLAAGTRRSLGRAGSRWSPVLAGVGGAVFVAMLGNLDGAIQVGQGVWRVLIRNMPFGAFDFWRSSRMMPPDPPGHEITEFPFFTFLFADLHSSLIAIPFALLVLGLCLAVVLGAVRHRMRHPWSPAERSWSMSDIARLVVLGVAVGALRLINTWDYPTYMVVSVASVFLAAYFRNGGLGLLVLVELGVKSALVFLVGYLAFLPFHLNYETFYASLDPTTNQTVLWQFLAIHGLFIFIVGSFVIRESRDWLLWSWRRCLGWAGALVQVSPQSRDAPVPADERRRLTALRASVMTLAAVAMGFVVSVTVSGWLGSTIPFLLAIEALALVAGLRFMCSSRPDAPYIAFVVAIIGLALALAIGLDIFRVEGDIDRMNSVFKFYLQVWVMLALSSAYLLWRLVVGKSKPTRALSKGHRLWLCALVVLIVSVSIYPVLGTQVRLRDRFTVLPPTLDGMEYMQGAVYWDPNGKIDLSSDYEGIRWLQGTTDGSPNIEGSPVILEGVTPTYRWGSRISVYTGLPTVVGWQTHQDQQRAGYSWAVGQRISDVNRIYRTTDVSEALSLMRKYGVKYVYVGQLERLYYPGGGLKKFDDELGDHLDVVYQKGDVTIYRVHQG